mmetsp:Transcript_7124/g.19508  ORF Transcript_7124/g.19508 Transcript_7124/m.19508 type:complete len:282 (-) Transcript_7124:1004-1849(-)
MLEYADGGCRRPSAGLRAPARGKSGMGAGKEWLPPQSRVYVGGSRGIIGANEFVLAARALQHLLGIRHHGIHLAGRRGRDAGRAQDSRQRVWWPRAVRHRMGPGPHARPIQGPFYLTTVQHNPSDVAGEARPGSRTQPGGHGSGRPGAALHHRRRGTHRGSCRRILRVIWWKNTSENQFPEYTARGTRPAAGSSRRGCVGGVRASRRSCASRGSGAPSRRSSQYMPRTVTVLGGVRSLLLHGRERYAIGAASPHRSCRGRHRSRAADASGSRDAPENDASR